MRRLRRLGEAGRLGEVEKAEEAEGGWGRLKGLSFRGTSVSPVSSVKTAVQALPQSRV